MTLEWVSLPPSDSLSDWVSEWVSQLSHSLTHLHHLLTHLVTHYSTHLYSLTNSLSLNPTLSLTHSHLAHPLTPTHSTLSLSLCLWLTYPDFHLLTHSDSLPTQPTHSSPTHSPLSLPPQNITTSTGSIPSCVWDKISYIECTQMQNRYKKDWLWTVCVNWLWSPSQNFLMSMSRYFVHSVPTSWLV